MQKNLETTFNSHCFGKIVVGVRKGDVNQFPSGTNLKKGRYIKF